MTSGGKDRGTTSAGAFLEAREAFLEEPFAPLTDDLAARVESRRNLIVAESFGGKEDYLGPDYVSIRQRIFPGLCFETSALIAVQLDSKWALPRHRSPFIGRSINVSIFT
jgi:hypothetical protein